MFLLPILWTLDSASTTFKSRASVVFLAPNLREFCTHQGHNEGSWRVCGGCPWAAQLARTGILSITELASSRVGFSIQKGTRTLRGVHNFREISAIHPQRSYGNTTKEGSTYEEPSQELDLPSIYVVDILCIKPQ